MVATKTIMVALVVVSVAIAMGGLRSVRPCSDSPPPGLMKRISELNPLARLLTDSDLSENDAKLFQKDHPKRCPGSVSVDFQGDGVATWAIVLLEGKGTEAKAELLIARREAEEWKFESLEKAEAVRVPVIWSEGPGHYEDAYGEKEVNAQNEVIVFAGYESWAILYAWNGEQLKKIWISD